MKNKNFDQIFRDKVEKLNHAPSGEAWTKINSSFKIRRKKTIWLLAKAAIIILICLSAAYMVYQINNTETDKGLPLADVPTIENKIKSDRLEKEKASNIADAGMKDGENENPLAKVIEKPAPVVEKRKNTPVIKSLAANEKKVETAPENKNTSVQPESSFSELKPLDIPLNETMIAENISVVTEQEVNEAPPVEERPVITIIYKSGGKNQSSLLAANREDKASTFEKIMDKAKEIKHSDLGLSELREAKDELLALNFKSDRIKKQ